MISERKRQALWQFARNARQKGLTLHGTINSANRNFGQLTEEEINKLTQFYNQGI